ncbi:YggS family pyridoxal phosphate-dependent enzyme [Rothia sp. P13129]|uniref:YggS family pyridoxal phosphate-dependent enzyme n=1 Tax=Rothia sp. P13129 TaxID=3402664 RepID=UPI003ACFD085
MLTYSMQRAEELKSNLMRVQERIRCAEQDYSGSRTAQSHKVELTVVTKFFPAEDILALYHAGVRSVGENRDQEAHEKARTLEPMLDSHDSLRWSFIGQLQRNKAKSVVRYAHEVHSVDRISLVEALNKAKIQCEQNGGESLVSGPLSCFVQVNLLSEADDSSSRGGATGDEIFRIAERLEQCEGLSCSGVMAVAPLGGDAEKSFEKLYGISQKLQEFFPQAREISAGMSSDLEEAIRWGSTRVRVGSEIMGARP